MVETKIQMFFIVLRFFDSPPFFYLAVFSIFPLEPFS